MHGMQAPAPQGLLDPGRASCSCRIYPEAWGCSGPHPILHRLTVKGGSLTPRSNSQAENRGPGSSSAPTRGCVETRSGLLPGLPSCQCRWRSSHRALLSPALNGRRTRNYKHTCPLTQYYVGIYPTETCNVANAQSPASAVCKSTRPGTT